MVANLNEFKFKTILFKLKSYDFEIQNLNLKTTKSKSVNFEFIQNSIKIYFLFEIDL